MGWRMYYFVSNIFFINEFFCLRPSTFLKFFFFFIFRTYSLILAFIYSKNTRTFGPVIWGCRIHPLYHCREVRLPQKSVLVHDIKQSDGEAPVKLEICGMQSIPSLPSLICPIWPGVVAHFRILSMDLIKLFYI